VELEVKKEDLKPFIARYWLEKNCTKKHK